VSARQHVPLRELDQLAVELGAAGAGHDDVDLLLLAVTWPNGIRPPGA
jgi:hypothetical protein